MSRHNGSVIHSFKELFESDIEETIQQNIFDFFPGIIYVYDADNKKLRYVNKKISEILGYSYDDLNDWNHDLTKLVFKEDIDTVQREIEKFGDLNDDDSLSYHCRLNRKEGDWIHFQVAGKILKRDESGKASSLLFIAQDVSDYVKAEEELKTINAIIKEKEELMVGYKEQIDVKEEFLECGSWEIIMKDKSISWSDGMYRIFGYDPKRDKDTMVVNEELYRSHMTEIVFENAEQFRENVMRNENNYNREYEILTKSGEKRRIETFAKIIRDSNGDAVRVLGTTQNVTRTRNFESELEQNISKLQNSVTNLEEFTYIASHDIQEPLRKIASFSERMKSKFASDLNDEAKSYLDRILNTSKKAHLLIDGLMSFLQLDHQHQLFKQSSLNTLVEEVKIELELRVEEAKATIITKNLPHLEVIPLQLKQVLTNLILNAVKFRRPEVPLVIEIASKKLTITEVEGYKLNHGSDFYEITVRDNGVGFIESPAGKMFQMFQRFHNKSDYPGAGIGLAICKKIIDKHNGLISARNVPGQGATFSIILPQKQKIGNETE